MKDEEEVKKLLRKRKKNTLSENRKNREEGRRCENKLLWHDNVRLDNMTFIERSGKLT